MYHFWAVTINSDRPGGDGDRGKADTSVDDLVADGRYADAAALARRRGEYLRAAELYERIWEFGPAADCARDGGDLPRALRNAIDARDETRTVAIAEALDSEGESGQRLAMDAFAGKRRYADAATRAEAVGEVDKAIEYFKSAHFDLDAARLLEAAGRDREAGRLLERFVELGPPGEERARAQLQLGRLLGRRMNHEAAARYLQEAARTAATRAAAQRALVVSLAAMGLRDAARDVLVDARSADPELPIDIDVFLRDERKRRTDERDSRTDDDDGGQQIIGGRYRLGKLIGSGGAGRVFRARDEVGDCECAIKILHTAHSRGNRAYERFVREAKLASSLRHPNLVEVSDFSADQGYLVMELMTGGSLVERIAKGPLPGPMVRRLAIDVLAGLELAHQRGVIHRDVKPANVFFDARGTAKLGDFGVAHLLDLGQTQTGGLIGTLAYMAPEQITGAPLTITADLYSLGITIFEALTARLPFLGPDFVAQHLGEEPPAPSSVDPEVAAGWDEIIAGLLRKNPGERYSSIDDLRRAIADVDLGAADQPVILSLPRAGSAAPPRQSGRISSSMAAQREPRGDDGDEDSPRYQFETAIGRTDMSQLSRAVDGTLYRSVIIERYHEGAMDEATERRLYALARGGGPFLQRALAYDRVDGVAVFEAPSGTPIGEAFAAEKPTRRQAARLLKRLARAVAPLHDSHNAHGALNPHTVVIDDDVNPTVLVCGLGRVAGTPGPRDDVRAIVALITTALRLPDGEGDPIRRLAATLAPDASEAENAQISALCDPEGGEELYAFADAVEVAMLRARRRSAG